MLNLIIVIAGTLTLVSFIIMMFAENELLSFSRQKQDAVLESLASGPLLITPQEVKDTISILRKYSLAAMIGLVVGMIGDMYYLIELTNAIQ